MFGSSKAIPSSKGFGELCTRLGASELITGIAAGILHKFWLRLGKESDIPIWAACAIFLASQSLLKGPEPGIPLSQILTVASIRLYDFFGPLKEFMSMLRKDDNQGIPLDESLVEKLQFKYVSVTLVFEKYTELYHKFIKEADGGKYPKSPSKRNFFAHSIFRFTWLLFLLAKSALFHETAPLGDPSGPDMASPSSKPPVEVKSGDTLKDNFEKGPPDPGKEEGLKSLDFIPSLHLLLCCLDFLLGHVPEEMRKLKFPELEGKPGSKLDSLLYICRMNHANYEQAREMQQKFYDYLSKLCRSKTLTIHPTDSTGHFLSGLLDRFLPENLKSLNTEYELLLYATGLFDERLFLEGNEQVQSPRPGQVALMTPIKATLGAHDWLVKTLTPLEDSPSPKLKLFYEGQPELLQNLLQKITTWMKPLIFEVENLYRRLLVTKLYFRIFENILVAESKLKSTKYPILR